MIWCGSHPGAQARNPTPQADGRPPHSDEDVVQNALRFLLKMIFNIKNGIINEKCEQSTSFSLLSILPQSGMKLFFGTIAVVSQTLQEFRLLKTNLPDLFPTENPFLVGCWVRGYSPAI